MTLIEWLLPSLNKYIPRNIHAEYVLILTYQIHEQFHGLISDDVFGIVHKNNTILSIYLCTEDNDKD